MQAAATWLVPILLGVFYLIAFFVLGYGLLNARRSIQAATWPTTPATLTTLDVVSDDDRKFRVRVKYTYTVDGMIYESDRLAFGYSGGDGEDFQKEILQTLREADQVNARYDPSQPWTSCLSCGRNRSIQDALRLGTVIFLFLTCATLMWWFEFRPDVDRALLDNLIVR